MKKFDVLAFLDEAKRLTALTIAALAVTGAVLLLDRAGGPLSAILGILAATFAGRLLQQASMRPAPVPATSEPVGEIPAGSDMTADLQRGEQVDAKRADQGPATETGKALTPPAEKNLFRPI